MRRLLKVVVIIMILALGLGAGIFLAKNASFFNFFAIFNPEHEAKINVTSTVKEILPISEYACLVYHYTDVISHSDVLKIGDRDIPFTEKKAIYTIEGTIKLGFDGKDITIISAYDDITVRMPEIKILSHEIYPETFNLYDERTGLFNRYTLEDANNIQMMQKTEREKKVNENAALFAQARESAEQQFRTLLENLPGIKGKYNIRFAWGQ